MRFRDWRESRQRKYGIRERTVRYKTTRKQAHEVGVKLVEDDRFEDASLRIATTERGGRVEGIFVSVTCTAGT
jgi:hypothetical protein